MKKAVFLIVSCFVFFSSTSFVEARSGCCSHHGGVCGCGCCDGTSLSAKCAPYYPACNEENVAGEIPPVAPPTSTPYPTRRPTAIPTLKPTQSPTPTYTPVSTQLPTSTLTPFPSISGTNKSITSHKVKQVKRQKSFWEWLWGK